MQDFRRNTLIFPPVGLMLIAGLLYIAFIIFRYVLSISKISRTFIMKTLSDACSGLIEISMWFLALSLFLWCITFIDL